MQDKFIQAIHDKNKVRLTFFSKDDGRSLTRLCAPMDLGPSRRATDKSDRYHLWDYESDTGNHVLSLLPNQIISVDVLSESFEPEEFITWNTSKSTWFIARDWGQYS